MELENNKNKALSKEEVKTLLSLIERSKIISNKTNITSNKSKLEEWERIANTFNATVGICRRTPQQLRLKWENLKKTYSRRRSSLIIKEQLKSGSEPPGNIPPDEVLDRVTALLGNTGKGLTVMYDSDEAEEIIGDDGLGGSIQKAHISKNSPKPVSIECPWSMEGDVTLSSNNSVLMDNEESSNSMKLDSLDNTIKETSTPLHIQEQFTKSKGVKRNLRKKDIYGCRARNLALAKYYTVKTKLLESKFENIILQNEKLKLEIENLKKEHA